MLRAGGAPDQAGLWNQGIPSSSTATVHSPFVQESVVSGAQEDRVPEGGLAAVGPAFDVVRVSPAGGDRAVGEGAAAVAVVQGTAEGRVDDAVLAADVERLAVAPEHDGDDPASQAMRRASSARITPRPMPPAASISPVPSFRRSSSAILTVTWGQVPDSVGSWPTFCIRRASSTRASPSRSAIDRGSSSDSPAPWSQVGPPLDCSTGAVKDCAAETTEGALGRWKALSFDS
jgi:hypothetical protein